MLRKTRLMAAALLVATCVVVPSSTAVAASGASGARDDDRHCAQELEAAIHQFDEAFIARDFDSFMSFVLDDAVQIDYLGHVFDGKEAIAEFTRAVMANAYTFTSSPVARTFHKCESAIDVADTVFTIPGRLTLHLLDTVGWHRVHGQWQVIHIQNTEIRTT